MRFLSNWAVSRPKSFLFLSVLLAVVLVTLVVLPTLNPTQYSSLNSLQIDTDPENMLSADEPVRVQHNNLKKQYDIYDIVVVGVVNDANANGVFNKKTLNNIYQLTEYIKTIDGVMAVDLMSPSTVDNIEQEGVGSVSFNWLMEAEIADDDDALIIRDNAMRIPMLRDTLVSGDGTAIALYVPITSKDISYEISQQIRGKIVELNGQEEYHITGLPVSQDQFGVEMFKQMAQSAPMAMGLIFVLMFVFFRNIRLIISPMIVALLSVAITMALLVISGNTVHIMSSMIPIFIMPIAVLDAVHILSEFYDRYQKIGNREHTIKAVMDELSQPMLFTSLTTFAGFISLYFTPIPPVQVFGVFVAIGVLLAWLLTITLVPAYIMLMSEKSLEKFGMKSHKKARILPAFGTAMRKLAVLIVLAVAGFGYLSYIGINKIVVNDNPVKWFEESHEIRIADKALNEKFAGTYMAYLSLKSEEEDSFGPSVEGLEKYNVSEKFIKKFRYVQSSIDTLDALYDFQYDLYNADEIEYVQKHIDLIESYNLRRETFKKPEVLAYIEGLQKHLQETGLVGKSSSLSDIVKTVYRDLHLGDEDKFEIPDSMNAVAQTLLTYQNSHRPQDLWHNVTPDFRASNIWIQLKSGDNKDMQQVIAAVDEYMANNKPPAELSHEWFGLTYINVEWQNKMVGGMADAFIGSFIVVFVMMVILFRSVLWGALAMIPLAVTIAVIYGIIGFIGKDYDMPVAVLSSLSLGLAVDYAIHFLARTRAMRPKYASWAETIKAVFDEPARAIIRNVIVIGVGFVPLLFAPLLPYQTVGIFISSILLLAGLASLMLLPALITLLQKLLFRGQK